MEVLKTWVLMAAFGGTIGWILGAAQQDLVRLTASLGVGLVVFGLLAGVYLALTREPA